MKFSGYIQSIIIVLLIAYICFLGCEKGKKVYIEKKGVPVIVDKKDTTTHFEKEVKPKPKKTFKVAKKEKETPYIEVINLDTLAKDSSIINIYNDTTTIGRAKIIQRDSVEGVILKRQLGCIGCFDTTYVYVTDTLIVDKPCRPQVKNMGIAFGIGYVLGILTGVFAK